MPILHARKAWMPSAMPTSAIMRAALIFFTSSESLVSRSGKKVPLRGSTLIPAFLRSRAMPWGKLEGTVMRRMRSGLRMSGMTSARPGFFDAIRAQLFEVFAERENFATSGLFTRAIDLEIAHDDVVAAAQAQVYEGVGHEHAGDVEHVRVMITIGDNEKVFGGVGHGRARWLGSW